METRLFGPVPSKRLGRSLGIDLVPFKTCTYNCTYCQLGPTTVRTCQRKEWVPYDQVLAEIREKLHLLEGVDYLTFSGSGEPTLHLRIGDIIGDLKQRTRVPVAVLTNGSLLWREDVQDALLDADLVIPSLDAPDEHLFRRVNRPHPELSFEQVVEGMVRFRERFKGRLWLEVFLLAGITGMASEVKRIARLARSIKPDCVQLLTVTRPPQETFAEPVSREHLERFAGLFEGIAAVVPETSPVAGDVRFSASREQVMDLLERRPCTVQDICRGLGIPRAEAGKYLEDLLTRGYIKTSQCNGEPFYFADSR